MAARASDGLPSSMEQFLPEPQRMNIIVFDASTMSKSLWVCTFAFFATARARIGSVDDPGPPTTTRTSRLPLSRWYCAPTNSAISVARSADAAAVGFHSDHGGGGFGA